MSYNEKDIDEIRDRYVEEASFIIHEELNSQTEYAMSLQSEHPLKNVDLLPDLLQNASLPKQAKRNVAEYTANIKKIIVAAAHYIDGDLYGDIENKVSSLGLGKFDRDRVVSLIDSQRELSGSFQTLVVTIEVFKSLNKMILEQIDGSQGLPKIEQTRLLLKNAILVYALSDFTKKFLETFGLRGVDNIMKIKKEVYYELDLGDKKDLKLSVQLKTCSEPLKESVIGEIASRREVRQSIRQKWEEMMLEVKEIENNSSKTKSFLGDLGVIKDNAKGRIDVLQLIAVTQVVRSSLEAVNMVSSLANFTLAPLDGRKACELLGIEF